MRPPARYGGNALRREDGIVHSDYRGVRTAAVIFGHLMPPVFVKT
jgi:hypothetical protein